MALGNIARRWRELQGSNNWKGLLDPLDLDLRKNILIYGDHAQATYDAFNGEHRSKYAGSSKYGKRNFFEKVSLTKGPIPWPYEVSRFLYATSKLDVPQAFVIKSLSREAWSYESNWMGYVAVTTDARRSEYGRRDITIAWRGTAQTLEWIDDFNPGQVEVSSLLDHGSVVDESVERAVRSGAAKVHKGWFEIYTSEDPKSPFNKTSARAQVLGEIKRLLELYKGEEDLSITFTGHSLGAALSTLCAFDIVLNGLHKIRGPRFPPIPVTVIAFASPRVGNVEFKQAVDKLNAEVKILRIKNSPDLVPLYPLLGYADVGVEIRIDTENSPYLNRPGDAQCWHNLEGYLHAVAGTQGAGKKAFKLEVDRDVALVNKSLDWLKEEYLVPASWRTDENKGMVQGQDGHWSMIQPLDEDVPQPEDNNSKAGSFFLYLFDCLKDLFPKPLQN